MTPTPKLLVYRLDQEPAIEAYCLALYLGYAQQHLLRKQVLTDWAAVFVEGTDYRLVHDPLELARYERWAADAGLKCRPMKPARGRMFLLRPGLAKLLERTSKDTTHLRRFLEVGQIEIPSSLQSKSTRDVDSSLEGPAVPAPSLEPNSSWVSNQALPLAQVDPGDRSRPLEERKFEYEVLERLLAHLLTLKDPALRHLAIVAAEAGLGRPLEHLREQGETPAPAPVKVAREPGPFPHSPGTYYPLKEIGRRAGGYTPIAAGKAANLVARRHGYTPDEIRDRQLPFNELVSLPDPRGKARPMYRFNASFANEVVHELRSNRDFTPEPTAAVEDFAAGAERFPKLSRGPFEDDEPAAH